MLTYVFHILLAFFASVGIIMLLWLLLELCLLKGQNGEVYLFMPLDNKVHCIEHSVQRVLLSNMPVIYDKILLVDCGADEKTLETAKYLAMVYPSVSLIRKEQVNEYFS